MKFKYQPILKEGYNKIVDSSLELKYIKEFGILIIKKQTVFKGSSENEEIGLIILEGSCSVRVRENIWENIGRRKNVFKEPPAAIYVPPNNNFEISGSDVKVAFCKALASSGGEAVFIDQKEVRINTVGKDNWSREVRNIIGPSAISQNLIVGETINPSGNWSGTPPHKHEGLYSENESCNEELYYFIPDKEQGWGIERLYDKKNSLNELIYLEKDTVTIMPKGYHQVVSAPGYNLYYLWFLAGKNNKLTPFEDPDHNWIKEKNI